jgi:PrtD family type I secretion system ABC transporter
MKVVEMGMGRQHGRSASLARVLRSFYGSFLIVALFSLVINLAMLISPLYMLQVYDRVLTSQSLETLFYLTLLALMLLALNAVVEIARARLLVRIGTQLDERLSDRVFGAAFILRLAGSERSPSQSLRDLESVRTFLTGAGIIALFDAPWAVIYLALVFVLHPLLGTIAVVGAAIILSLALLSELVVRKPLKEAGSGARKAGDFTDQLARNAEAVQAMGLLNQLTTRWAGFQRYGVAWQAIASDRIAILQAVAKFARMAQQILILGAGAWLAVSGQISAGSIVAASIIVGRGLAPVEALIGQWRSLVNARLAAERLGDTLSVVEDFQKDTVRLPAPEGRLHVQNVGYRREEAATPTLAGISFELDPGETLGVIGPTGAGKSTLARLLVGLEAPSNGSIRLDGVEVSAWPREEFGPYVGYLPQDVELLTGTVAANIARFGELNSEQVVAAAKLANVHDVIVHLPDGYETRVGDGGQSLSGGQRQRIALGRAVYGRSRYLVLDEPNANLDAEGEMLLRQTLSALKSDRRTVIVITHRPSLLDMVDKLLVLREGRVQAFGPRDEILSQMKRLAVLARPGSQNGAVRQQASG